LEEIRKLRMQVSKLEVRLGEYTARHKAVLAAWRAKRAREARGG
jgi:phage shock protein A